MFNKYIQNNQEEDFKQKRQQYSVKIRNDLRQKEFQKKRIVNHTQNQQLNNNSNFPIIKGNKKIYIVDENYRQQINQFLHNEYAANQFQELIQCINNQDIIKQHYGLIGIRKIVSIDDDPPIQQVIDSGLVPKLIQYMSQTKYPQLQLQATWTLTNVASGTTYQTQTIIDKGGIPLFIRLLSQNKPGIVQQAVWAIGNIAGDCNFFRDIILKQGGLQPLLRIIQNTTDKNLIKQGCWAVSNLCRGSPLPKYDLVKQAIPTLCKVLKFGMLQDKQVISDVCWSISYLTQGPKSKIQRVVQTGVVPVIVQFTKDAIPSLIIPSIRLLGNIATGNQLQTNQILKAGILDSLQNLLDHHKKTVRRQTCWVISNIAAGTRQQIAQFLQRTKMVDKLLKLFESDSNQVRKEICWIFANMSHLGQPETILEVYQSRSITRYYVNCLLSDDHKIVGTALDTLYTVLRVGDKVSFSGKNILVQELYNNGAVQIFEKLQYHQDEQIYFKCVKIVQKYFDIEDPLQL